MKHMGLSLWKVQVMNMYYGAFIRGFGRYGKVFWVVSSPTAQSNPETPKYMRLTSFLTEIGRILRESYSRQPLAFHHAEMTYPILKIVFHMQSQF